MPFFNRLHQSKEAKKKFDDLFTHYQRDLDTINCWNFSSCEMTEIPVEVIEWADMLNKKGLIFSHNFLHKLSEKLFVENLARLLLLDLSNNGLKSICNNMCNLKSLMELDLSCNKLDWLPDLSNMRSLQVLSIKDNRFMTLPETIPNLKSLRKLDISQNNIIELPKTFAQLLRLKTFEYDKNPIESKLRMKSIQEIMMSLNPFTEYVYHECLPDDFDRKLLDDSLYVKRVSERSASDVQASDVENLIKKQLQEEDELILRHLEQQKMEELILIQTLTEMEKLKQEELAAVSLEMDEQRNQWVSSLLQLEEQTRRANEELIMMHERLNRVDHSLVANKDIRDRQEKLAAVQAEEYAALHDEYIKKSMERQLKEMLQLEQKAKDLDIKRDYHSRKILRDIYNDERILGELLEQTEHERDQLVGDYIQSEKVQKQLVHDALVQQDAKRNQLIQQVEMIEQQLVHMTMLEMKRRDVESEEDQQMALKADRQKLSQLWAKVQDEKMEREKELYDLLLKMEEQKQEESDQYWLVQYQRLLSTKPVSIASKEFDLDINVIKFLNKCGASHYVPLFAKHRMTHEALLTLTDENLRLMGMSEIGLRATILSAVSELKNSRKFSLDSSNKINLDDQEDLNKKKSRSDTKQKENQNVPALNVNGNDANANNQFPTSIRLENECCVCMERSADLVFFPCGHVCCCSVCGVQTTECPLCRITISNTVFLQFAASDV
ncbi:E3 ubiquitin-protein ligase LRSAM1-like [Symsagittifera roscoffensis]|uniref:E3 ubiquitin-protein ligase LRSAM1-like n=1 Tax=Symsagittifera roscoffensis TaxID=84072 RepID=UPI00307CB744